MTEFLAALGSLFTTPIVPAAFGGVAWGILGGALPGITILQFQDGKCVERWSNADMLGLLIQVGAVPPPG